MSGAGAGKLVSAHKVTSDHLACACVVLGSRRTRSLWWRARLCNRDQGARLTLLIQELTCSQGDCGGLAPAQRKDRYSKENSLVTGTLKVTIC